MTTLSKLSLDRLKGVDKRLVALAKRAREISPIPFEITEGLRTKARQQYLYSTGKSKTLNSKHLTGHAFDFVAKPNNVVSWKHHHYLMVVERALKPAAKELGLTDLIEYGIFWKTIVDGPHVQINV
jgi:peptidoglycan LD-endopeptidase CwlK